MAPAAAAKARKSHALSFKRSDKQEKILGIKSIVSAWTYFPQMMWFLVSTLAFYLPMIFSSADPIPGLVCLGIFVVLTSTLNFTTPRSQVQIIILCLTLTAATATAVSVFLAKPYSPLFLWAGACVSMTGLYPILGTSYMPTYIYPWMQPNEVMSHRMSWFLNGAFWPVTWINFAVAALYIDQPGLRSSGIALLFFAALGQITVCVYVIATKNTAAVQLYKFLSALLDVPVPYIVLPLFADEADPLNNALLSLCLFLNMAVCNFKVLGFGWYAGRLTTTRDIDFVKTTRRISRAMSISNMKKSVLTNTGGDDNSDVEVSDDEVDKKTE